MTRVSIIAVLLFALARASSIDTKRWVVPSSPLPVFPSASLAPVTVSLPTETDEPTFSTSLVGRSRQSLTSFLPPGVFQPNNKATNPLNNPKFGSDGDDAGVDSDNSTSSGMSIFPSSTSSVAYSTLSSTSTLSSSSPLPTASVVPQGSDLPPAPLAAWTLTPSVTYTSLTAFLSLINGAWGWNRAVTQVTQGIPAVDWTKSGAAGASAWNNGSAIRASYPKNSLTPGKTPLGGLSFYAQPLTLTNANNVTLGYSVFFPQDFDFVLGGKLPGLWGGKHGCSGGAAAQDCFSTRMMWRTNGMGELYLYAPRSKQSTSLCTTPPLTYCNTADGMSIGRGAFTFARGAWTHIRQDVWLNTPGVADGGFNIWVNGKLVINSNGVYFRNTQAQTTSGGAVKAVPVQILIDSIPNTGFQGTLPSLAGLASPFAAASPCQANAPINYVYANGAQKVVVTSIRKNYVTRTRTVTRYQTSTSFSYTTSLATVTKPTTVYQTVATVTSTHTLAIRDLEERAPKTTTRVSTKQLTKTVTAFTTVQTSVNATQTYRSTQTIPSIVTTQTITATYIQNVVGTPQASVAPGSSTTALSSSSLAPSSSSLASSSSTTAKSSSTKSSSVKSSVSQTSSSKSTSKASSSVRTSPSSTASSSAASPSSTLVGNDVVMNPKRPYGFGGIMSLTFFGGSADKWRATKDEHSYFNNWEMAINN